VPVQLDEAMQPIGAVSVSALAFRLPLAELEKEVPRIRGMVARSRGLQPAEAEPSAP